MLCSLNLEETTYHLFFECPFSTRCSNFIGISWDHVISFFDTIQKAKVECQLRVFMESILAVSQLGEPVSFYHFLEMQANYVLVDTGWQEARNQWQCMLLLRKATNQTAPCPCWLLPSLQNQTAPCGLPCVSATSLAVCADAGQAAAARPTCMPIFSLENYVLYIL